MRAIRAVLAAAACIAAIACWEEPVREHLHLTLVGDQVVVVTAVHEVAGPEVPEDNPQLAARLDERRAAIERGFDRWRPLYDELQRGIERTTVEKEGGVTRRAVYSAATDDFDSVARLLASQGLDATFEHRPIDDTTSEHELRLWPVGSPPATSNERAQVERRLDEWSVTVAEYLAEASALYQYLDRRPDRAVACLSDLFDLLQRQEGASEPLDRREEELVAALKDRIPEVAAILQVGQGEAYTLNELSRLAFDPFPVRLTVAVRGAPVTVEGFVEGSGFLERPSVDLWRALASLEGRWLKPDLVTAMIAPVPDDQQPDPDPESFATIPRRWTKPPQASEVAAALRAALVPAELHRVLWQSTAAEAIDPETEDPWHLVDAALAELPP